MGPLGSALGYKLFEPPRASNFDEQTGMYAVDTVALALTLFPSPRAGGREYNNSNRPGKSPSKAKAGREILAGAAVQLGEREGELETKLWCPSAGDESRFADPRCVSK
jgi:hypothetical protein